jgi:hypothetical protein
MELLQEFVSARVNMSDAEREVRERELLRRRRERAVVVGWFEAVRARRTVRAVRPAAGQKTAGQSAPDAVEAPERDLANAAR